MITDTANNVRLIWHDLGQLVFRICGKVYEAGLRESYLIFSWWYTDIVAVIAVIGIIRRLEIDMRWKGINKSSAILP